MFRSVWKKVQSVEGELDTHLADLLVLLGYLSVGIYGGGYQYVSSFNEFFALPVKADPSSLVTFVVFLENVVLGQSFWLSILFCAIFASIIVLNFVIRNVFKVWFSYLSICLLAFGTIGLCVFLGAYYGVRDAETQVSLDSTLPKIDVSILKKDECSGLSPIENDVQLLFSDDKFIYFFTPVDPGNSEILIDSVSVACVSGIKLQKTGG